MGDSAINFNLPDTNGNIISLDDFTGDVVVLNFFAHWCVPCYSEAPMLEDSVWQAYLNSGVTVLGIGFNQTVSNIQFFADSTHVTYPLLRDTAATVFNSYGVPFLPHNFIIDQNGIVAHVDGVSGFNILVMIDKIDSLLNITSINENPSFLTINKNLILNNAYPNPFNSTVIIQFQLNKTSSISLEVFNIMGQVIIDKEFMFDSGIHDLPIEMKNFSSGQYFYSLKTNDEIEIGRFILQK